MANDIALSSAQRTTLLSLQRIDRDSAVAQRRLSFGQRIVDVTDGASQFFQSRSLGERAALFSRTTEQVDQAISGLQNQITSLSAVRSFIQQAIGLTTDAESAIGDTQTLTAINVAYKEIFTQLFNVVSRDTEYNGLNLLKSTARDFTVTFSDDSASNLEVDGKQLFISAATALTASTGNLFAQVYISITTGSIVFDALANVSITSFSALTALNISNVAAIRTHLNAALGQIEVNERFFGNNIAILQTRLEFGRDNENDLRVGRDKIVIADINEEATILTTLRTRNQIGIGALAANAEAQQQLLRLLQ